MVLLNSKAKNKRYAEVENGAPVVVTGETGKSGKGVQGEVLTMAWSPEETETYPRRTDRLTLFACCHRHGSGRARCAWIEAGGRGFRAMRRRQQG